MSSLNKFLFVVALSPFFNSAQASEIGKLRYDVYLNQSIDYVDGLASSRLIDSTLYTPQRVSDTRSNTGASIKGLYALDAKSTLDFGYEGALTAYFDHTTFNLMTHNIGAGYTTRINQLNVVSMRGDVTRALADTDYSAYYKSAHVGAALAQSYSGNFSSVYGIDLTRTIFDSASNLNGTLTQLSATPSYSFDALPLTASVILRYGHNNAKVDTNSFGTVDVIPMVSYTLPNKHFIEANAQLSVARFDGADTIQTTLTRKDKLYKGALTYYAPLSDTAMTGNMLGYAGYNYTRNDSNIDRQDYDSSVFTAGLTTRF